MADLVSTAIRSNRIESNEDSLKTKFIGQSVADRLENFPSGFWSYRQL